jgi:8-amino-7-oxononanoate synthase
MLDFTSSLYLGMQHPSWSLRPWAEFTTGAPAVLYSPASARIAAQSIAVLQGCEAGVLGTSTLHLFWDLFGILAKQRIAVYLDAGAYPIARWGTERAAAHGIAVRDFPHHDANALQWLLNSDARKGMRPVVVTDGFCPGCGQPAPLASYLENARAFGGRLVIDDTQALGIFGSSPRPGAPYGTGGGGMLAWSNIGGPDVLVVSSLAKAFGVPVAVLAGSQTSVRSFEEKSETRVHCSPPSTATIHALEHALEANSRSGNAIRLRLAALVKHFRKSMAAAGFNFSGELFPVQTLEYPCGRAAAVLYERLRRAHIFAVLGSTHNRSGVIRLLITAKNATRDFDYTAEKLAEASKPQALANIAGEIHETTYV